MVSVGRPNGLWLVIWQRHWRREFEMPPFRDKNLAEVPSLHLIPLPFAKLVRIQILADFN